MLKQGKIPVYILEANQLNQIRVNKNSQPQILKAVKRAKIGCSFGDEAFSKD